MYLNYYNDKSNISNRNPTCVLRYSHYYHVKSWCFRDKTDGIHSASHIFCTIVSLPAMNRKRALILDTFTVKKRKNGTEKFGPVGDCDGRSGCLK